MKNFLHSFAVAGTFALFSFASFAQTPFEKATTDKSKLVKQVKLDFPLEGRVSKNGRGYSAHIPTLGKFPAKVALLTYYIYDPGIVRVTKTSSATTVTTTTTTTYTTVGNASAFANGMLKQSLPAMKETFKNYGVELMEIGDVLTTEAKKQAYQTRVVENGTWNKVISLGMTGAKAMTREAATGYRIFIADAYNGASTPWMHHLMSKDGKLAESIGTLANELDVDAVLVCFVVVEADKKGHKVESANMYLFGPNPVKLEPGEKDGPLYHNAVWYAGAALNLKKMYFQSTAKKDPNGNKPVYGGFENVEAALIERMCLYMQEKIEKGKK